jgi:hypothetical protein
MTEDGGFIRYGPRGYDEEALMGDTGDREASVRLEALCPPRDLRREARRLERLREGRAAVIELASRRRPLPHPDSDPKDAA